MIAFSWCLLRWFFVPCSCTSSSGCWFMKSCPLVFIIASPCSSPESTTRLQCTQQLQCVQHDVSVVAGIFILDDVFITWFGFLHTARSLSSRMSMYPSSSGGGFPGSVRLRSPVLSRRFHRVSCASGTWTLEAVAGATRKVVQCERKVFLTSWFLHLRPWNWLFFFCGSSDATGGRGEDTTSGSSGHFSLPFTDAPRQ